MSDTVRWNKIWRNLRAARVWAAGPDPFLYLDWPLMLGSEGGCYWYAITGNYGCVNNANPW